jgi:manganese efflux pump family protein
VAVFETLLLAVGLAMDAFAVAVGVAVQGHVQGLRPAFRIWFHFGLFQFLMPILGWFLGTTVARWIGGFDHWVAFALLVYVGGKMIHAGCQNPEVQQTANGSDPTRGWTLVGLSVATSLDAMAVGLSLAMVRINIWSPSVIIGIVTASLSFIGIELGNRLGRKFGNRAEVVGGLILVGIGIRIVLGHIV